MNSIYQFLKNTIATRGYKLTDMQSKIKKYHILGDITEEQADELLAAALAGVSIGAERPDMFDMLIGLSARVEALEIRVKALESGDGNEAGKDTEEGVIEPWSAWDGLSDRYQRGALVSHAGRVWESTYAGQNVWEPGAVGIDERFWILREDLNA